MKKKYIYILPFFIAAALFCGLFIFKTPPGAAGVTDNVSIISVDPDLVNEIGDLATAAEDLSAAIRVLVYEFITLAILITVLVFSFINRDDPFIKTAAGLLLVFAGLSWLHKMPEFCLVLIVFGAYYFFYAIYLTFATGKAARGLSQFKEWYKRARGG